MQRIRALLAAGSAQQWSLQTRDGCQKPSSSLLPRPSSVIQDSLCHGGFVLSTGEEQIALRKLKKNSSLEQVSDPERPSPHPNWAG